MAGRVAHHAAGQSSTLAIAFCHAF
jgi:hypothetical protein